MFLFEGKQKGWGWREGREKGRGRRRKCSWDVIYEGRISKKKNYKKKKEIYVPHKNF